ncbi:hypothetical protein NADFUDRAFT_50663 [Nadsonia fulvescens var. elongata DSM 6958]|uniref:Uncharacterized protein n=1 Tax=Nadsonia fulvescens var. elongata DSM 6958 TaxID=857566 RepID=A0A1E3PPI2_9ASCO|nr:hypothetical protein NADFUDRAFT_50663 [Nadsonia fulvescens var. elongata DSM 6958]
METKYSAQGKALLLNSDNFDPTALAHELTAIMNASSITVPRTSQSKALLYERYKADEDLKFTKMSDVAHIALTEFWRNILEEDDEEINMIRDTLMECYQPVLRDTADIHTNISDDANVNISFFKAVSDAESIYDIPLYASSVLKRMLEETQDEKDYVTDNAFEIYPRYEQDANLNQLRASVDSIFWNYQRMKMGIEHKNEDPTFWLNFYQRLQQNNQDLSPQAIKMKFKFAYESTVATIFYKTLVSSMQSPANLDIYQSADQDMKDNKNTMGTIPKTATKPITTKTKSTEKPFNDYTDIYEDATDRVIDHDKLDGILNYFESSESTEPDSLNPDVDLINSSMFNLMNPFEQRIALSQRLNDLHKMSSQVDAEKQTSLDKDEHVSEERKNISIIDIIHKADLNNSLNSRIARGEFAPQPTLADIETRDDTTSKISEDKKERKKLPPHLRKLSMDYQKLADSLPPLLMPDDTIPPAMKNGGGGTSMKPNNNTDCDSPAKFEKLLYKRLQARREIISSKLKYINDEVYTIAYGLAGIVAKTNVKGYDKNGLFGEFRQMAQPTKPVNGPGTKTTNGKKSNKKNKKKKKH